jgi:hypothetical protein
MISLGFVTARKESSVSVPRHSGNLPAEMTGEFDSIVIHARIAERAFEIISDPIEY